jgi:hypothetical protein
MGLAAHVESSQSSESQNSFIHFHTPIFDEFDRIPPRKVPSVARWWQKLVGGKEKRTCGFVASPLISSAFGVVSGGKEAGELGFERRYRMFGSQGTCREIQWKCLAKEPVTANVYGHCREARGAFHGQNCGKIVAKETFSGTRIRLLGTRIE